MAWVSCLGCNFSTLQVLWNSLCRRFLIENLENVKRRLSLLQSRLLYLTVQKSGFIFRLLLGIKAFQCSHCSARFSYDVHLKRHIRAKHKTVSGTATSAAAPSEGVSSSSLPSSPVFQPTSLRQASIWVPSFHFAQGRCLLAAPLALASQDIIHPFTPHPSGVFASRFTLYF